MHGLLVSSRYQGYWDAFKKIWMLHGEGSFFCGCHYLYPGKRWSSGTCRNPDLRKDPYATSLSISYV